MAQAYTPGLKVSRRTRYRVRRVLPIPGDVLVQKGDLVASRDVVAQTFMPGDIFPINLANQLSVGAGDAAGCLVKKPGDPVTEGELIARSKGIFGFFQSEYRSPVTATIESVSKLTGQMILRGAPIPVQVRAFLAGEVVELLPGEGVDIEAEISHVQGIFGIGGEAYGPLRMAVERPEETFRPEHITDDMSGAVLVGGARMLYETVQRAVAVGAAAIISGGIDDEDLKNLLGYDLGVAVTGTEQIGTTVIITEGFGDIAMAKRTFELLASREGDDAAVNGTTQIRAGVLRPEILVPTDQQEQATGVDDNPLDVGSLDVGRTVRIIRDPHFGLIGTVTRLPSEPQRLDSGSKARVLEVKVDGDAITVPRANVELIGG